MFFFILEKLRERQRDPDEKVRMEVVSTICEAASEKCESVPEKVKYNIKPRVMLMHGVNTKCNRRF